MQPATGGSLSVALERYRLARGAWPKKLPDLVPDYLSEVPIDCFDGQPLRCKHLKDGVVVYSVGPDGKDNDGRVRPGPDEFPGPDFEGFDIGFRLWDVGERRQPPRPPLRIPEP